MINWQDRDPKKDERKHGKGEHMPRSHVVPFKALRQFNTVRNIQAKRRLKIMCGRMVGSEKDVILHHFNGEQLPDKRARALARRECLDLKEFLESFEFFAHVRQKRCRTHMTRGTVADLCCGHGFTGLLFAIFEPAVERVLLIDRMKPPSFLRIWEACVEVAPWIRDKVEFMVLDLAVLAVAPRRFLPPGTTVLAVHACGQATDICLEVVVQLWGAAAALPCCHRKEVLGAHDARPAAMEEHLGRGLAQDIDRTYRMHQAGYDVRWEAIPPQITGKNRLLLCLPREQAAGPREQAAGPRLRAARQQSIAGFVAVGLVWLLRLQS